MAPQSPATGGELVEVKMMGLEDEPEATRVAPYDEGLDTFPITPNTAIIVGSHGHQYDDLALEAAARTSASYVGLLGSKRKAIMIYESLLKRGTPIERLREIRSPVGLDLGGRTPEEIAVSIMAEVVAFRYGHAGGSMKLEEAQLQRIVAKVGKQASPAR
mgnify:CR=1 FL=1